MNNYLDEQQDDLNQNKQSTYRSPFPKNNLLKAETQIMQRINFEPCQISGFYSILELFQAQGILCDHDILVNPNNQKRRKCDLQALKLVEKYVEFFSLMVLQDHTFINENPYIIACSIVSAARR